MSEPAIVEAPENTAEAVSSTAEAVATSVAHSVASVAESTLSALQGQVSTLTYALTSVQEENRRLASELAEARREPETTIVVVEAEEPAVTAPATPVAAVEEVTVIGEETPEPSPAPAVSKPRKPRRGLYGRSS